MKKLIHDFIHEVLPTLVVCVLIWIAATSAVYQISNPEKTVTEAFLHIPKSAMLDFKD